MYYIWELYNQWQTPPPPQPHPLPPNPSHLLIEFFRIEFYRIYRIYRIGRKLFLVALKIKIIKISLLQIL